MSVHCDDQHWNDRAKKALKETGARSIASVAETGADYGASEHPTERAPEASADPVETPEEEPSRHVSHESLK